MNNQIKTNSVSISGSLVTLPEFRYEHNGEKFYGFTIASERKSGTKDILPVICPEILIQDLDTEQTTYVNIVGEYRSRNVPLKNGKSKLELFIFANELIELLEDANINEVKLIAHIVKQHDVRKTPGGFELCDALVAVNRKYRRSDYLPVISWNRRARYFSNLPVGTKVFIEGRIQSREYTKNGEKKIAYEISIMSFEEIKEENDND